MPWPDDLLKKVHALTKKNIKKGKKGIARGTDIKFLNRHENNFDWDNDDMDGIHVNKDEVELIHPDIVANIPGIDLVSDSEELGGATEEPVREVVNFPDRAADARQAEGLNKEQSRRPARQVVENTIVEDVESDDEEDPGVDGDRDEAPDLVERGDNSSDDESDDDEPVEKVEVTPMGRGARERKQINSFNPSYSGKRGQFHSTGINCAGPGWESNRAQPGLKYAGAGYSAKQGVIAMKTTDDAKDAPRQMSEEEMESHIIGVILAQQYNLRKGLELFSDRAEAAVDAELLQIHALNAFVPKLAKDLSYE